MSGHIQRAPAPSSLKVSGYAFINDTTVLIGLQAADHSISVLMADAVMTSSLN